VALGSSPASEADCLDAAARVGHSVLVAGPTQAGNPTVHPPLICPRVHELHSDASTQGESSLEVVERLP